MMSNKLFASFFIFMAVSGYAECLVSTDEEIAYKISHGHAWQNHAHEFVEKQLPAQRDISTPELFQEHIIAIMTHQIPKKIPGDRRVYWDPDTGTIVFYDPNSNDCGTAFRPREGQEYYERVLQRKDSKSERIQKKAREKHIQPQSRQSYDDAKIRSKESMEFQCDGRAHCSQMTSCAEAMFFLKNCPNTKMDGNDDGIPCEKQWCH